MLKKGSATLAAKKGLCGLMIWSLVALHPGAQAQTAGGGTDYLGANLNWEMGAHAGNLLPNQIEGVTEIFRIWGLRAGRRTGRQSFMEVTAARGGYEDVSWADLSLSARMDVPLDSVVGLMYLGADAHYFKPLGEEKYKLYGGGHVGAGVLALIGGLFWFRADMKFNVHPGTSMHLNFGLSMRF